jgi:hypothetical protein
LVKLASIKPTFGTMGVSTSLRPTLRILKNRCLLRVDSSDSWLGAAVVVMGEEGVFFGVVDEVIPRPLDLILVVDVIGEDRTIFAYLSNGTVWRSSSPS